VFLKDLRCIRGYSLKDIIIIDNSLLSFSLQPENGIPVSNYEYDPTDVELKSLTRYLISNMVDAFDVRIINREEFKL
jgi:RNA polymerase II subunit A small phosphatase-like protein